MRNSKKGVSVIIGTILLMFIGVASSVLIYNAFSHLAVVVPDPGTATILEDVSINQVSKNNNSYSIYFQNTGQVNEVIDSIYVLDANGNLVRIIPITPITLSPNQYTYINITADPTWDTSNWVYFQAFTTRDSSDMLEVSPSGPMNFVVFNTVGDALINGVENYTGLNNTYVNDTINVFVTNSTGFGGYTGPAVHPNRAWDATGGNAVGAGGADIHLQHGGGAICMAEIPNPSELVALNISVKIFTSKSGTWVLNIWNWTTGNWATGAPGNVSGPIPGHDFYAVAYIDEAHINGAVNPTNGTLKFLVICDQSQGTAKFTFNDVNIIPTYRGTYDGIFTFITTPYNSIQSLTFDSTIKCNVSSSIIQLRIYNYNLREWEIIDNYYLSDTNLHPFSTTITANCIDYVSPERQISIEFAPYMALPGTVQIAYDFLQMKVNGVASPPS
jgi:hypothetical protein